MAIEDGEDAPAGHPAARPPATFADSSILADPSGAIGRQAFRDIETTYGDSEHLLSGGGLDPRKDEGERAHGALFRMPRAVGPN